mmetsp:Transcript_39604/g.88625  ORF Transcript_39604/g.88625 Transcript_39604/m.88625 type:complete len:212 (+) Transcript_39604:1118-1753(+)
MASKMSELRRRASGESKGRPSSKNTSARPFTPRPMGRCRLLDRSASATGYKFTSITLFRFRAATIVTRRSWAKSNDLFNSACGSAERAAAGSWGPRLLAAAAAAAPLPPLRVAGRKDPGWAWVGSGVTKLGRVSEARLQTAASEAEVNCTISVHRFEHVMVPRFCWLDLLLHASLYSMYGVPVSIWESQIANHRSCALTTRLARPSDSYLS